MTQEKDTMTLGKADWLANLGCKGEASNANIPCKHHVTRLYACRK